MAGQKLIARNALVQTTAAAMGSVMMANALAQPDGLAPTVQTVHVSITAMTMEHAMLVLAFVRLGSQDMTVQLQNVPMTAVRKESVRLMEHANAFPLAKALIVPSSNVHTTAMEMANVKSSSAFAMQSGLVMTAANVHAKMTAIMLDGATMECVSAFLVCRLARMGSAMH